MEMMYWFCPMPDAIEHTSGNRNKANAMLSSRSQGFDPDDSLVRNQAAWEDYRSGERAGYAGMCQGFHPFWHRGLPPPNAVVSFSTGLEKPFSGIGIIFFREQIL